MSEVNFRPVKVWVLVGMEREVVERTPEGAYPVVAGCVDDMVYEIEPYEDSEKRLSRLKGEFTPDPGAYEWREVEVELDVHALRKALLPTQVSGSVGESRPA